MTVVETTQTVETTEVQPCMQVSVSQAILLPALSQCLKSTTNRLYAILSHVLITASDDGKLTLTTTNLSTAIVLTLDADVTTPGVCTIPARLLHDLVKTFPGKGIVQLSKVDDTLHVVCGKRSFALTKGLNPKDFPQLVNDDPDGSLTLSSSTLIKAIREVEFSAASDDSRPVFTGVYVDIEPDLVNFVTCNEFTMAISTIEIPVQDQDVRLLIPAPAMRMLAGLLPDSQDVKLSWKHGRSDQTPQVVFSCGNLHFVARQIEGTYPNYMAGIPKNHKATFTVTRTALTSLLDAARPFTRDSSNILRIAYCGTGLTFTAKSDDLGEFREEMGYTPMVLRITPSSMHNTCLIS